MIPSAVRRNIGAGKGRIAKAYIELIWALILSKPGGADQVIDVLHLLYRVPLFQGDPLGAAKMIDKPSGQRSRPSSFLCPSPNSSIQSDDLPPFIKQTVLCIKIPNKSFRSCSLKNFVCVL